MSADGKRIDPATIRLELIDERWTAQIAALVADPWVRRSTRIPEPPPADFAERWIGRYVSERSEEGQREGFVALDQEGGFLGLAMAPTIERNKREIELGYIVAEHARGRGAATAMLMALTRWAFEELGIQRAYLIIHVENRASARVAERAGYTCEGVMRSILLKPGERVDAGLWSRLPSDPPPPGTR